MKSLPDVFSSIDDFRSAFNAGLMALAQHPSLGTFILACANASMDENLFVQMHDDLHKRYDALLNEYQQLLLSGQDIKAVEEDLLVFFKLHTIGFDKIQQVENRDESVWRVQFNHLRSLRPRRISQDLVKEISQDYTEQQFNFNKPFLQKECFWQGELLGRQVDLFYNKYPFADLHGLLIVDKTKCLPQRLTKTHHQYIFSLLQTLSNNFRGLGFGYNSLGAYASVNHLHFQMFVDEKKLPVCDQLWQHNGGTQPYPLACYVFNHAAESWRFIEQLHQQNQPYNLLYANDVVYIVPRQAQGNTETPVWSSGLTWYEVMGEMLCFNRHDYESLNALKIEKYLAELAL